MRRAEPCDSQTPERDPAFPPDDPDARERLERTLNALTQVLSLLRELKRRADETGQPGSPLVAS